MAKETGVTAETTKLPDSNKLDLKDAEKRSEVLEPVVIGSTDEPSGGTEGDNAKVGTFVSYAWPDGPEATMHNQGQLVSAAIIVGYNAKDKVASLLVLPNSSYSPFYVNSVQKGGEDKPNTFY